MDMTDQHLGYLAIAFAGGILVALLHQWGLWLTIERLRDRQHGSIFLFISFAGRMAILLVLLAAIALISIGSLLSFAAGLIITRLATTGIFAFRPSANIHGKAR